MQNGGGDEDPREAAWRRREPELNGSAGRVASHRRLGRLTSQVWQAWGWDRWEAWGSGQEESWHWAKHGVDRDKRGRCGRGKRLLTERDWNEY